MATVTPTQPDFTTQDSASYKAAIDQATAAHRRLSTAFAAHEANPADMTVAIAAGAVMADGALVEVGAQSIGPLAAPVTEPRIDRIVLDVTTGAVAHVEGAESAAPVAPAIPVGRAPLARVVLAVDQATITNLDITDERVGGAGGDFLPRDGSQAMTGDLDLDGNNVVGGGHVGTGRAIFSADGNNDANYWSDFHADDPSKVASRRRASAGQTADIDQWSENAGGVLARVTKDGVLNPLAGFAGKQIKLVNSAAGRTLADGGCILRVTGGVDNVSLPPASTVPDGWSVIVLGQTGNDVTVGVIGGGDTFTDMDGSASTSNFVIPGNGALYGNAYEFTRLDGGSWFVMPVRQRQKNRVLQRQFYSVSTASYASAPWTATALQGSFTRLHPDSAVVARAWGLMGMQQGVSNAYGVTMGFAFAAAGWPNSHDGYAHAPSSGGSTFNDNTSSFAAYKVNPPGVPAAGATDTLILYMGHVDGGSFHIGRSHNNGSASSPPSGYGQLAGAHMEIVEFIGE